jgi:hypothetical protein
MSAIFIETFFSFCGACALADDMNASGSIAAKRLFLAVNDIFSSCERSLAGTYVLNTAAIVIFDRLQWNDQST